MTESVDTTFAPARYSDEPRIDSVGNPVRCGGCLNIITMMARPPIQLANGAIHHDNHRCRAAAKRRD